MIERPGNGALEPMMLSGRLIREMVNPFAKGDMLLANMPAGGALPRMDPTVWVTLIGVCTVPTGKRVAGARKISPVLLLAGGEMDSLSGPYAARGLPISTARFASDAPSAIAAIATDVGETAREMIFSPDPPDSPACGKCPLAARPEACSSALAAAPSELLDRVDASSVARCPGVKWAGLAALEDVKRCNGARIGLWRALMALKTIAVPRFKGTLRTVAAGIRGDGLGRAKAMAEAPRVPISPLRSRINEPGAGSGRLATEWTAVLPVPSAGRGAGTIACAASPIPVVGLDATVFVFRDGALISAEETANAFIERRAAVDSEAES